jgi:ankyrin repeat protein
MISDIQSRMESMRQERNNTDMSSYTNYNNIRSVFNYECLNRNINLSGVSETTLQSENVILQNIINRIKTETPEKINELFTQHFIKIHLKVKDKNNLSILRIAIISKLEKVALDILENMDLLNDPNIVSIICDNYNQLIFDAILNKPDANINLADIQTGTKPLSSLILNFKSEAVLSLLKKTDLDLNYIDNSCGTETTPLFIALTLGRDDICLALLKDSRVNINKKDFYNNSLTTLLSKSGKYYMLKYLLTSRPDYIPENMDLQFTSLLENDAPMDVINVFLPYIDLNYQDLFKNTHLVQALHNNKKDVFRALLTYKSDTKLDLSLTNIVRNNILHETIKTQDILCVKDTIDAIIKLCSTEETSKIINAVNNDGDTPLIIATKENKNLVVLALMPDILGAEINIADKDGMTPIFHSIINKNIGLFNLFINSKNININYKNNDGLTPLMCALLAESSNGTPFMTDCGDSGFNGLGIMGSMGGIGRAKPNFNPSVTKSMYYVTELLKHAEIDTNAKNNFGQTALILALNKKHTKSTKQSMDSGSGYGSEEFASYPQCFGESMRAIDSTSEYEKKYTFIIAHLLNLVNIDINSYDSFGFNLAMYALKHKDDVIFNLILQNKNFDINSANNEGITLISNLVSYITKKPSEQQSHMSDFSDTDLYSTSFSASQYKSVIQMPKVASHDLRATPYEINFSLDSATADSALYSNSDPKAVKNLSDLKTFLPYFTKLLRHQNIDINKQDVFGNTIAMQLCMSNQSQLVNILLKLSPELDLFNYDGKTALTYAVQNNYWSIIIALLNAGADINIKNTNGKTVREHVSPNSIEKLEYIIDNLSYDDIKKEQENKENKKQAHWFF